MKKIRKVLLFVFIAIVVVVGAAVAYVKFALPDVGEAPELKVQRTPARVERGKYLAYHVSACMDCHSTRDWSKFAGPIEPGTEGSGGELFDEKVGFPGEVYVPNITPYHLKDWTDGELFRAITAGVKKDGSAIFPIMPYSFYGKMAKEDVYSIIAFIRTLPEKKTAVPGRKLNFPLNLLVNTMPVRSQDQTRPSESNRRAYGAYLVNAAACRECHTKQVNGAPVEGMDFAGGKAFQFSHGTVFSANITSHKDTGIGKWTKEQFVNKFRAHAAGNFIKPVEASDVQTIMPWNMYGDMKEQDLEAIFDYLQTLKPIENSVQKFEKERLAGTD